MFVTLSYYRGICGAFSVFFRKNRTEEGDIILHSTSCFGSNQTPVIYSIPGGTVATCINPQWWEYN